MSTSINTKSLRNNRRRRGTAVVELAVCVPVLVLIVLGAMSATTMIFMRTAAVQSAYETVKEESDPTATALGLWKEGEPSWSFEISSHSRSRFHHPMLKCRTLAHLSRSRSERPQLKTACSRSVSSPGVKSRFKQRW